MKLSLFITILIIFTIKVMAQQVIPLYDKIIPNSKATPDEEVTEQKDGITIVSKISRPTLSIFLPSKEISNGTAVIIFPGGGYRVNATSHEGSDVAKAFNALGVTAFVVKSRIPNDATMINREIGPLQDAQQAMKVVRERSKEWAIDPSRIGILGFSAGGHLAATLGTHYDSAFIPEAAGVNLRPDFMILVYPVISFQSGIAHAGSVEQLIGKNPAKEKTDYFSNELQVNAKTPPAFLVHASDDKTVKPENSIVFYQALIRHNVPAELHLYQNGNHGFGMNNKSTTDQWMDRCVNWMRVNGWVK